MVVFGNFAGRCYLRFLFSLMLLLISGQDIADASTQGSAVPVNDGVYVARVLFVNSALRNAFLDCLKSQALPNWLQMKRDGLVADQTVFEVISVLDTMPGVPEWNFLFLTHLRAQSTLSEFLQKQESGPEIVTCEKLVKAELRRTEVLSPTPNSNYPRFTAEDDRQAIESHVEYVVEYISVHNTPADLSDYRKRMELSIGPAVGQVLIPARLEFSLVALETVSVIYVQQRMPDWNQIHINGNYHQGRMTKDDLDAALKRVSPSGEGVKEVFGTLNLIRTKPRNDEVRQLYDLAVH